MEAGSEKETTIEQNSPAIDFVDSREKGNKKKKKKLKAWQVFTIFAGVLMAVLVVIMIMQMAKMPKGMPVEVVEVSRGNIMQTVDTSGPVESEESKTYFAQVSSTIDTVSVKQGQIVKKGDILLTYNTQDMEDALKQAELEAKISSLGADSVVIGIDQAQSKAADAAANYSEAEKYVAHYNECVGKIQTQLSEAEKLSEKQAKLAKEAEELAKKLEADPTDKKTKKELEKKQKELEKVTKSLESYDVTQLNRSLETCSGDLAEYKARLEQYKAEKEATDPAAATNRAQQAAVKESARLSTQNAQEDLAKAKEGVRADFDGIVSAVTAVAGQTTAPGVELFTIQNKNALKVSLSLSKYDVQKVQIGQKAKITVNGKEYTGSISNISHIATSNTSGAVTIPADVHIDNPDDTIVIGLEAKVSIESAEEKDILMIPMTCVNYSSDGVFCYAVVDGKIKRCNLQTGVSDNTYIQVLSGLQEGDQVVTNVTSSLEEGMGVTPMPSTDAATDDVTGTDTAADDTASDEATDEQETDASADSASDDADAQ